MFPIVESVHVLAICLLVGTVLLFDLRLLGLVLKRVDVSELARQILPLTWAGFAIMFLSGFLLFWAEAAKMYTNPAFRIKILLMLLAGLNPLIFHFGIFRSVNQWNQAVLTPRRARLAAMLSLTLWSGIVIAGRAIAYY